MVQRVYVGVYVEYTPDGVIIPRQIRWPDGRRFEVDKVGHIDRRPAPSGGLHWRFAVNIMGREKYLWLEEMDEQGRARWFVER